VSETVAQYLLAQGKALPTMVSSLVGLLLAPVLYWGLVVGAGLGLTGAAVASAGIQASLVVQLLGYLLLRCVARACRVVCMHGPRARAVAC
jgi:Na+-driven multidrug efflux pump